MRIESSQVSYVTEQRSASSTTVIDENLTSAQTSGGDASLDQVQLSGAASSAPSSNEDLQDLTPKQKSAALIIEAFFGVSGRRFQTPSTATPATAGSAEVQQRTEIQSESEQTSFEAQGVVETADGRSVQFAATLTEQQEYESYSVTTGSGKAADHLAVNF